MPGDDIAWHAISAHYFWSDSDLQSNPHQDQSMAHGSDRSRYVDINFSGKRYMHALYRCVLYYMVEALNNIMDTVRNLVAFLHVHV